MKGLIVLFIIIAVFAAAWNVQADNCRSEKGGHCVRLETAVAKSDLAAVSGAPSGLGFLNCSGIGDCISSLYFFGMGLVGISALIMMLLGGVLYMTAGDSQDQTNRARAMMTNAIGGLVLALVSWLILFTINRDLVKKLELSLTPIAPAQPAQSTERQVPIENSTLITGKTRSEIDPQLQDCLNRKGKPETSLDGGLICLEKEGEGQRIITGADREECLRVRGAVKYLGGAPYCSKKLYQSPF